VQSLRLSTFSSTAPRMTSQLFLDGQCRLLAEIRVKPPTPLRSGSGPCRKSAVGLFAKAPRYWSLVAVFPADWRRAPGPRALPDGARSSKKHFKGNFR